jgi:hypothetical protein
MRVVFDTERTTVRKFIARVTCGIVRRFFVKSDRLLELANVFVSLKMNAFARIERIVRRLSFLKFVRVSVWTGFVTAPIWDGFCSHDHQCTAFFPVSNERALLSNGAFGQPKLTFLARAFVNWAKTPSRDFQRALLATGAPYPCRRKVGVRTFTFSHRRS